jgi:hypothetical protein
VTFKSGTKIQKAAIDEHGDENVPIVGAVMDNEVFTDPISSSEYAADGCGKYAFWVREIPQKRA